MPNVAGVGAWVLVDGQPLTEYSVSIDSNSVPAKCEAWLASESGKRFGFRFSADIEPAYNTFAFKTEVDGQITGTFMTQAIRDVHTTFNVGGDVS